MPAPKLLPALLLALLLASQAAAENITELRIDSITTPIESGGLLEFSFTAGNKAGPECSAQIEYGFSGMEGKTAQGKDSFYLETGQTITQRISLIIPSETLGVKDFFLEMECNDSTILASRVIEIKGLFPEIPQLSKLEITEATKGQPLQFAYTVESSTGEKAAILARERIVQDDNIVWVNSQNIVLTGSKLVESIGPALPEGSYKLIVEASAGSQTAKMARDFSIETVPIEEPPPIAPMAGLAAAGAAALGAAGYLAFSRKTRPRAHEKTGTRLRAKKLTPTKSRVCLAESEETGILGEQQLYETLQLAGIEAENMPIAAEFAQKTPVTQSVKSFVVKGRRRAKFETIVEIKIENGSNRNWTGLQAIARTPGFMGQKISEVSADTEMEAFRESGIISFSLEKVRAMGSARIVYRVPKLLSQEEANSVPLPVVIGFRESEPLVITKVKVERQEGEKAPASRARKEKGKS